MMSRGAKKKKEKVSVFSLSLSGRSRDHMRKEEMMQKGDREEEGGGEEDKKMKKRLEEETEERERIRRSKS